VGKPEIKTARLKKGDAHPQNKKGVKKKEECSKTRLGGTKEMLRIEGAKKNKFKKINHEKSP